MRAPAVPTTGPLFSRPSSRILSLVAGLPGSRKPLLPDIHHAFSRHSAPYVRIKGCVPVARATVTLRSLSDVLLMSSTPTSRAILQKACHSVGVQYDPMRSYVSQPEKVGINCLTDIFESHSARLFRIAYRMLGSRADAEDVLQDAYLRWHETRESDIQSPTAFLITITRRLCLDRLRHLKNRRTQETDSGLPEPIVEHSAPSPEQQFELACEISVAFLAVLERLGPKEWAAFFLREIFDYDYSEVAQMIGKSESACRQLIHR